MLNFNPFQMAVVNLRRGAAVAMAAPGSGKTAVIVERIRALIRENVMPAAILSLTFTKEGAREMTERAGLKNCEHKLFSTFHSWALAFIKHEYAALPFKVRMDYHGQPNPLCLPLESARTLAGIVRKIQDIDWKDAAGYISLMKRRGITPQQASAQVEHEKEELYVLAYQRYEHALREKGLLDFDSIVIETANLLERCADVAKRWQYQYLQVDEAQDTDAVQWRIVKAITARHGNVLAVGDENQGMYSWRGSESNLQSYFCGMYPGAAVLPLPINYRSTQAIVEYCKKIAPIQNDTVTQLSTTNEQGVAPEFRLYLLEGDEAYATLNACTNLGDTAVLARTNRQLAAFENECAKRSLRYKLLGKSGFWSQREVKDVIAIVGSVVSPTDSNVYHALAAKCELTKFLRKTGTRDNPGVIDQLKAAQAAQLDGANGKPVPVNRLLSTFGDETVRNFGYTIRTLRAETAAMDGGAAMQRVLDRFGVLSMYDEDADDDAAGFDNDPRENILKLVEYAAAKGALDKFYDYTQKVRRATLARTNCLTLSTIHQAKGKEWGAVFVVGVNEDVLPHKKGDESEERRIYFVACSRAAKRLTVSANGVPSKLIRHLLPKETCTIPEDPWAGFALQA